MKYDNNNVIQVCNSFPGKYIPKPMVFVTETVWSRTHSPPKLSMEPAIIKIAPCVCNLFSMRQPFDSSSMPVSMTAISVERNLKNHFSHKFSAILKRMTHTQTDPSAFMLPAIISVFLLFHCVYAGAFSRLIRNMHPVINDASR